MNLPWDDRVQYREVDCLHDWILPMTIECSTDQLQSLLLNLLYDDRVQYRSFEVSTCESSLWRSSAVQMSWSNLWSKFPHDTLACLSHSGTCPENAGKAMSLKCIFRKCSVRVSVLVVSLGYVLKTWCVSVCCDIHTLRYVLKMLCESLCVSVLTLGNVLKRWCVSLCCDIHTLRHVIKTCCVIFPICETSWKHVVRFSVVIFSLWNLW